MFDTLFSKLSGISSFMTVLSCVQNLMAFFLKDIQDESARDAAIDALIQVLQAHKSTAVK